MGARLGGIFGSSTLATATAKLVRTRERAVDTVLAAKFLRDSGVIHSVHASGLIEFARQARGYKFNPLLALVFQAANVPNKTAIVHPSRSLTYRELHQESNRFANALTLLGVTAGDRVGIVMPNAVEHLVAQLAIPRLGATTVEIGCQLTPREIAHILRDSSPQTLLYSAEFADVVAQACELAGEPDTSQLIVCGGGHLKRPLGIDYDEFVNSRPNHAPPRQHRSRFQGGTLVYTSGTTGSPKGARRGFDKIGTEAIFDLMAQVGMCSDDVQLTACPLYHSAAPAFVMMTLALGGTIVLSEHFDEIETLELIVRQRVTCGFMVPTMLQRLADVPREKLQEFDFKLRWVLSGAAPLATSTAADFQHCYGNCLWNFYGATETGLVTLAGPSDHSERPGTVGRVLRGNRLTVIDDEGETCDVGEIGEIYTANNMLVSEYIGDRASLRDAMLESSFSVGDLGRIDEDGFVYIESRKHDMVISGGVNIYPREIENALHGHPDIIDCAVIGVDDTRWGEKLVAYIVSRNADLTASDVISHCRKLLANYKTPRDIRFLDELPRTPTGKILKCELRSQ